jgi:hypothetical protein
MVTAQILWQILFAFNAVQPVTGSSMPVDLCVEQALILFLLLKSFRFVQLLLTAEPSGTIGDQNLFSSLDRFCGTYLYRVSVSTFPKTKQGGAYLHTERLNLANVVSIVPK